MPKFLKRTTSSHDTCATFPPLFEGMVFLNDSKPVVVSNITNEAVVENVTEILTKYGQTMLKGSKTLGTY